MKTKVKTIKQKVIIPASPKKFMTLMLTRKNTVHSQKAKPQAKQWSAANSRLGMVTFLENTLNLTMENE